MKKNNLIKMIIGLLALIILVFLSYKLIINDLTYFDNTIYNFIIGFKSNILTNFFKITTYLGSAYFLIPLTILLIVLVKDKNKKIGILLALIIPFLINTSLKYIFLRQRPILINLVTEHGFSFPSGHSCTSLAFYGFLIYLIYNNLDDKISKFFLISLLTLLVLIICISRIYLGVHYASDVLAGICLGFIVLILFIYFYNKRIVRN